VKVKYSTEPHVRKDLTFGIGSNPYYGIDRVQDLPWTKTALDDQARIKHGYDWAGNRLWRQDVLAAASAKEELYTYDGISEF
jgi:hypothetical protein